MPSDLKTPADLDRMDAQPWPRETDDNGNGIHAWLPWRYEDNEVRAPDEPNVPRGYSPIQRVASDIGNDEDGEFIAAAPSIRVDLRDAVAELRATRKELSALREMALAYALAGPEYIERADRALRKHVLGKDPSHG